MNRPFTIFIITLALILSGQMGMGVFAQEQEFHSFTDKKGQAIEAVLLSISPDMKTAKIRRKDNREFNLVIVTLSLDDQQVIKNWLKLNPIKAEYNLDVSFDKHLEDNERLEVQGYDGMKWVTDTTTMEIIVKNRSRDDLIGASLEYYIAIEQGVNATALPLESQRTYGVKEWWYSNDPSDGPRRKKGVKTPPREKPLWLIHGKEKLKNLPINNVARTISAPFPLREISQSQSRNPKDILLGVIVRITDQNGNEISVHRSTENKLLTRSWEEIAKMPTGDRSGLRQPDRND